MALISALPMEESSQMAEETRAALSRVERQEQQERVIERAKQAVRRLQNRAQLEQAVALISALPLEESSQMAEEMRAARSRIERQEREAELQRNRRDAGGSRSVRGGGRA